MTNSNEPWSEQFRLAGKKWVTLDGAASMLERSRSAFLNQRINQQGSIPYAHAERNVKGGKEWADYNKKMVDARTEANLAKIELEYIRMRAWEENSENANKRAEMRL